ncbi:uncharacterized protein TNCV_4533461 [Trichonephila clavipes]|nr:uncharacterized protein TNCV_4533461 [Trichonephila clavipes]
MSRKILSVQEVLAIFEELPSDDDSAASNNSDNDDENYFENVAQGENISSDDEQIDEIQCPSTSQPERRKHVCLQWIRSHVGVPGNEAADELAGRGCDLPNPSFTVLTHTEIHSFQRNKMNLTWRNPLAHHWYAAKSPDKSIHWRSSRAHQTALACLKSGHLRSMTFVQGVKSFFTCPFSLLASPAQLLDCWGISLRQLYEEQDLILQDALFICYKQSPDKAHSVGFSQRSSSPRWIEDETFNDSDIINNLTDYEDGKEESDSVRANKNMQGSSFPTN